MDQNQLNKEEKLPDQQSVESLDRKKIKNPELDHATDWILSDQGERSKKPISRKNQRKLLFEVFESDLVYRTLYSLHSRVLDHSSWATMFEMVSGRFKDGDFEPSMSHIVGHRKIKTEKDKLKL